MYNERPFFTFDPSMSFSVFIVIIIVARNIDPYVFFLEITSMDNQLIYSKKYFCIM